jgi:hypothetical protein
MTKRTHAKQKKVFKYRQENAKWVTYARGKMRPHDATEILQPAGTSGVAKMTMAAMERNEIINTNQ